MNTIQELLTYIDPKFIISTLGLAGVIAVVFAETGLFFGFFLPGDSLLFTAGLLAHQGYMNIFALMFGAFIAAVLGDAVGYAFGKKVGEKLFDRPDSIFFKKKYLVRTQEFYAVHGKKTLILARFVPIVRTFAPILAGVGGMKYKEFFTYNVVGGFVWTFGLSLMGYVFGTLIPDPDRYILPVVIAIIIISFIPPAIHLYKARRPKNIVQ